ncbi:MAG: CRISPR system precrRNA processing endoribonuclease RAMP protein Cas6, partial [Ktedonobacteraceae bacterium]|nr:CRISPR system precrRNA processing endoribonuclease RAMP protein Cas6 [Ktedonobacteraceae bacterium]
ITLDFLTPTRIIDQERLVRQLTFRALILRISERLANLQKTYGELSEEEEQRNQNARSKLIQLASQINCIRDETRWEEVQSYSRRQHRFTPVSGLTGQITFAGDITPFRQLLTWGELIHIGKSAVKGNGWYKIIE